jgi:hypothetical protein
VSELRTILAVAMEAQGAVRIAILDARSGDVVAERGEEHNFGGALLVGLHQELLTAMIRGARDVHTPDRRNLRDLVLHFDTRCHIFRPIQKSCGPGDLYLHLVLDRASADVRMAQTRLSAVAGRIASLNDVPEFLALPDTVTPQKPVSKEQEIAPEPPSEPEPPAPEPLLSPSEKEVLPPFLFDDEVLKLLSEVEAKAPVIL